MREITKRFRDTFENFKYGAEHNIDSLMIFVDAIIEMLTITDNDDADRMQKLASFTKILSSDYCRDIIDVHMIRIMYEEYVLPILSYLDEKYDNEENEITKHKISNKLLSENNYDPKENIVTHEKQEEVINTFTDSQTNPVGLLVGIDNNIPEPKFKNKDDPKTLFSDFGFRDFYPTYIRGHTDIDKPKDNKDALLFELIKETSKKLYGIYNDYIITNEYRKYKSVVLGDLLNIYKSIHLTISHNEECIRLLSNTICEVCSKLIIIVQSNCVIKDSDKLYIGQKFSIINDICR